MFDEIQTGSGFISRQFSYHAGQVTDEHKQNGKLKSSPTTSLVSQITLSDSRAISYEYDEEERITRVTDSIDGITEYTYDAQDNPISYLGHTLTWEKGRELKSFDSNTYTYNASGVRTSKTFDTVRHTFTLDGAKIVKEAWGENSLVPFYNNEESVCGILFNGTA